MFYKSRCASYVVMSQNGCCGGGEPCRQLVTVCDLAEGGKKTLGSVS